MARADPTSRYHRQMLIDGIGAEGQERLGRCAALIVGCGALGTVIADLLARAGVGTLMIADRDIVDRTNLQRQVLFDEADAAAGVPKAEGAARRLGAVNSCIRIVPVIADVSSRNVESLVTGASADGTPRVGVVLDGTDNFATRYLLNDVCVKLGVPLVYGGAVATGGMTMTIVPALPTPCLRCVFPEPPDPGTVLTCDTAGILGPVAGIVAAMQAAEAIKLLLGRHDLLARGLRQFDLWSNVWRTINVGAARRAESGPDRCPCCAERRFEFLNAPTEPLAVLCGADAVQITPAAQTDRSSGAAGSVDLAALATTLAKHGASTASRHMLRATIDAERVELTVFRDGRAIVRGTREPVRAKAIYAKYVGA